MFRLRQKEATSCCCLECIFTRTQISNARQSRWCKNGQKLFDKQAATVLYVDISQSHVCIAFANRTRKKSCPPWMLLRSLPTILRVETLFTTPIMWFDLWKPNLPSLFTNTPIQSGPILLITSIKSCTCARLYLQLTLSSPLAQLCYAHV